MYTLIIDGQELGDFNNWPGAWDRGQKKPQAAEPAPVAARPAVEVDPASLLKRYRAGEHEAVWRDLVALGADVRQAPYAEPAAVVAEETMGRAKQNVELLIPRLQQIGYKFCDPKHVHRPLTAKETSLLERAERKGLWLPLSLRAWLKVVGQLDLNGSHASLCFMDDAQRQPGIYADPLQVWVWQLEELVHDWTQMDPESRDPQQCLISMTAVDKAARALDEEAVSGYYLTLPNGAADAALEGEPHGITFVEHLRLSFQWGGFPGWEKYPNRPEMELAFLKEGLLSI